MVANAARACGTGTHSVSVSLGDPDTQIAEDDGEDAEGADLDRRRAGRHDFVQDNDGGREQGAGMIGSGGNITSPVPPGAGSSGASTTSRAGKASSDPAEP